MNTRFVHEQAHPLTQQKRNIYNTQQVFTTQPCRSTYNNPSSNFATAHLVSINTKPITCI